MVRDDRRARWVIYGCIATFLLLALTAVANETWLLKVDAKVQEILAG